MNSRVSFSCGVTVNWPPTVHSKDSIKWSITLSKLIVVGWHFLPLPNTWLLATVHISLCSAGENVILSRPSYVLHSYTWNMPPSSTTINWSCISCTPTVDPIDVGISSINLFEATVKFNPLTRTWFLASINMVMLIHSPDVTISTCRHMLQTSSEPCPSSTSIHWVFKDLMSSIDSLHLIVTGIKLNTFRT